MNRNRKQGTNVFSQSCGRTANEFATLWETEKEPEKELAFSGSLPSCYLFSYFGSQVMLMPSLRNTFSST